VPLKLYEKLMAVSAKFPVFVVPILRAQNDPSGEAEKAYEFYFLQWSFHGAPPAPSAIEDPFTTPNAASNSPQISTVMFTPLQEYKMRETFATPCLVLTFYTDLSNSHGTVLMRGEITPGAAGAVSDAAEPKGRYLLSQEDAQLLAMQVQRFYLWENEKDREGERLLKVFHEQPQEFKWEDLLKHADLPM
jgi:ATP synthase mitochondrial F1 complex assembly factor 1